MPRPSRISSSLDSEFIFLRRRGFYREEAWIESRRLNEKRMVLVNVPLAQVRQSATEDAPLVFQARQNVLLELIGAAGGWLQVKHDDGQAGFVKSTQVWGA